MIRVNPYLNFDGTAEAAFKFYQAAFGGELTTLQRFGDIPASEQPVAEEDRNRIMHVALPIGEGVTLMGSDISRATGQTLSVGNNVYISLDPPSKEEADRLFDQLSAGGSVEMPMAKMFWGDYFGTFTDKFGIQWMINYHQAS